MAEKLKPCPFCGHSAALESVGADHFVMCDGCCAETARFQSPTGDGRRAIEHAIAAWNKRAQHAGEAVPFGWVSPTQGNYFTRNKTIANRIGGLMPVYAAPQPAAMPQGWKIVPEFPTPGILAAIYRNERDSKRAWRDALAAAPQPPAPTTTATPPAGEGEHE